MQYYAQWIFQEIFYIDTCVSNDKIELIFYCTMGLCINRTTQQMSLKANSSEPCTLLGTLLLTSEMLSVKVINLIIFIEKKIRAHFLAQKITTYMDEVVL